MAESVPVIGFFSGVRESSVHPKSLSPFPDRGLNDRRLKHLALFQSLS